MQRGALWNSFLLAAREAQLAAALAGALPGLAAALDERTAEETPWHPSPRLRAAYDRLPVLDFSRDFLEPSTVPLDVLAVPACGWSDLGTPERLASCLASLPRTWPALSAAALDLGLAAAASRRGDSPPARRRELQRHGAAGPKPPGAISESGGPAPRPEPFSPAR